MCPYGDNQKIVSEITIQIDGILKELLTSCETEEKVGEAHTEELLSLKKPTYVDK